MLIFRAWLCFLWILVLSVSSFGQTPSLSMKVGNPSIQNIHVPGVLVVKIKAAFEAYCFKDDINLDLSQGKFSQIDEITYEKIFPQHEGMSASKAPSSYIYPNLHLIYYMQVPAGTNIPSLADQLSQHEAVAYAEPLYTHQFFYQPNDPIADTTGGFNNMWHLGVIQAREAWDLVRNDTSVVVAIVDEGYELSHPDMRDNVLINYDDPIDGLDNDQDGYQDNYRGWDFGGNSLGSVSDNDPNIGNVHGHWVAGMVGARADNNIGIPGLCFNCRYLPIKVTPDDALGTVYYGYEGVVYAADQGADVINCSWGGTNRTRFGEDVIRYATEFKGAAVIAACGNSSKDEVFYPAGFDQVISVANSYRGDTLFTNSTFNYTVDLTAPGFGVASTFGSDAYWTWGGTSASSPVVASAVALTLSQFPQYTPFQAAQRVRVTSDDTYDANPGFIGKLGTGRVNMFRALNDPLKPSIRRLTFTLEDQTGDQNIDPGDTVYLSVDWINYLDSAQNLTLRASTSTAFNGRVTWLVDEWVKGGTSAAARFEGEQVFVFVLDNDIPLNYNLEIRLDYEDQATAYLDFEYIEARVNPSYLDVDVNEIVTTVTSNGGLGFNDFLTQTQGKGFRARSSENVLFEGSLLVGSGPARVSDHMRNGSVQDDDFQIITPVRRNFESDRADFESRTVYDDSKASTPIQVQIEEETFAWAGSSHEQYILQQYIITNQQTQVIESLYAGIFIDWDINPVLNVTDQSFQTFNAASYDEENKLAFSYDRFTNGGNYFGAALLSDQTFNTFASEAQGSISYSSTDKFDALRTQPSPTSSQVGVSGTGVDVVQFVSGGPIRLAPGETDTIVFALFGVQDISELEQTRNQALSQYECQILRKGVSELFSLSDSTPNTLTVIDFEDQNPSADNWEWDFGDGTTANGANVSHQFKFPGSYDVKLIVSRGACSQIYSRTVEVNLPSSLDDPKESDVLLFPNPTSDEITLMLPISLRQDAVWRMLNLLGQSVMEGRIGAGKKEALLHVGHLPAGVYRMQIQLENQVITKQVLINP